MGCHGGTISLYGPARLARRGDLPTPTGSAPDLPTGRVRRPRPGDADGHRHRRLGSSRRRLAEPEPAVRRALGRRLPGPPHPHRPDVRPGLSGPWPGRSTSPRSPPGWAGIGRRRSPASGRMRGSSSTCRRTPASGRRARSASSGPTPSSATSKREPALRDVLAALKACPARDKLLILDIMRPHADPSLGVLDDDVAGAVLRELEGVPDEGRTVLCAASAGQGSQASEALGRSAFNYYVDQGLRGEADATGPDPDGIVTVAGAGRVRQGPHGRMGPAQPRRPAGPRSWSRGGGGDPRCSEPGLKTPKPELGLPEEDEKNQAGVSAMARRRLEAARRLVGRRLLPGRAAAVPPPGGRAPEGRARMADGRRSAAGSGRGSGPNSRP